MACPMSKEYGTTHGMTHNMTHGMTHVEIPWHHASHDAFHDMTHTHNVAHMKPWYNLGLLKPWFAVFHILLIHILVLSYAAKTSYFTRETMCKMTQSDTKMCVCATRGSVCV